MSIFSRKDYTLVIILLDNVNKIRLRIQNTQSIVISSASNIEAKMLMLCMQERKSITCIYISFENVCNNSNKNDRD